MSSTDVSDEEREIAGFQFEPLKKNCSGDESEGWTTVYDDSTDDEDETKTSRRNKNVESWCSCGHCVEMYTEKECVCCHELECANYFDIKGNRSQIKSIIVS